MHIDQGPWYAIMKLWMNNNEATSIILASFLGISKLMEWKVEVVAMRIVDSLFPLLISSPVAHWAYKPAKQDIHYAFVKFVDVHSPNYLSLLTSVIKLSWLFRWAERLGLVYGLRKVGEIAGYY